MNYNILYSCVSHIGRVRRINQDNIICNGIYTKADDKHIRFPIFGASSSKTPSVFGIFDGMGGESCGEIAAYIAAQNAARIDIGKDAVAALSSYCAKTNLDICEYADENGIPSMGTTAAMLAFTDRGITLCNIGDSKVFRFCGGTLEQISFDHVSAAAYGTKPPLSQNLGIPPAELLIEPYFAQGAYNDDDVYLISSDGLTDMITTEEITEILASKPIAESCTELLEKALANGGRDNITIILCKIERRTGSFFRRKRKKEV